MLKEILEKAYKKENMQWRVYSFNPEKDNELVYTSKAFDCIADAQVDKVEQLKKHPNYTVEISTSRVEEAANIDVKNPGILEVPDGKKVNELPQSHFEKLVDKKGYAEVIRALTNLEVWNKDKNKSLSSWASNMADKLKKKYRPESAQYKFKVGDRVLYEGDKATVKELRTSGTGSLERPYYDVEKDKEKGRMTHSAREFELKPLQESAQKNEAKLDKGYDINFDNVGGGFEVIQTAITNGYGIELSGYSNNTGKKLTFVHPTLSNDKGLTRDEIEEHYDALNAKRTAIAKDLKPLADKFDKDIEAVFAKHGFKKA